MAGRLAERLLAAGGLGAVGPDVPWVEVTLRSPPPLGQPIAIRVSDDAQQLSAQRDGTLVAEARRLPGPAPGAARVEPVDIRVAQDAEVTYLGLRTHPFPTCWVCGPSRPDHDGYDLRPGRLDDDRTACVWTVSDDGLGDGPSPRASAVWAALDCPGAWTALDGSTALVLGRISAQVAAVPAVGGRCVVMGRLLGTEGRKSFTATTVYATTDDGTLTEPLGSAVATWIALG